MNGENPRSPEANFSRRALMLAKNKLVMNTIQRILNVVSAFHYPTKALRFLAPCALVAFGWFCGSVEAQIPEKIDYQGYLSSPSSGPITTPPGSPLSMTFRLFDVATNGVALWTETQLVTVAAGIFNVQLNVGSGPALAFDKPYFLEVTLGTGATAEILSPRHPLGSSPYALRANKADIATTAGTISGTITASQITGAVVTASADKTGAISFSLGASACGTLSLGVAGVEVGDVLVLSFVGQTAPPASVLFQPLKVTASGTATMRACNMSTSAVTVSSLGVRIIGFR
jgi:hypothetical protein